MAMAVGFVPSSAFVRMYSTVSAGVDFGPAGSMLPPERTRIVRPST
ncbi:hypothetical protein ACFV5J_06605 [Streptomyces zaomyceticus]